MDAKWRQLCPGARRNRPVLESSRSFKADGTDSDGIITAVVGGGQDGGQVAPAVLSNDAKRGEGASLAGDVEGGVPAVVHQPRVGAGLQELLHQLWLACDDGQVKGSLGKKKGRRLLSVVTETQSRRQWSGPRRYLSLVVLHVEEGVMVGQSDHLVGVVCGFMNDGQVEKPEGKTEKKSLVKIVFIYKKDTGETQNKASALERFATSDFCWVISTSCGLTHLTLYQFLAAGQGLS